MEIDQVRNVYTITKTTRLRMPLPTDNNDHNLLYSGPVVEQTHTVLLLVVCSLALTRLSPMTSADPQDHPRSSELCFFFSYTHLVHYKKVMTTSETCNECTFKKLR